MKESRLYEIGIIGLTVLFYWSNSLFQMVELAIMGVLLARLILDWIYYSFTDLNKVQIGHFFGLSLALSYGTLYLANVFLPMLSSNAVYVIVILFSLTTLVNWESGTIKESSITIRRDRHLPTLLVTILIIYVAAGTTYNSLYPAMIIYSDIDQFYNVLPFIPVAIIAGILVGKHTLNLMYVGIIFLGLAVISIFIPYGVMQFFALQTSIQISWALLDLFAWVAGARFALSHNNPRVQALFIASFLLGTTIGSVLAEFVGGSILVSFTLEHALLTLLPLFIALFIVGVSGLFDSDIYVDRLLKRKRVLNDSNLTPRERQIALFLVHDFTYNEISEDLDISINTLKTHTKNIYKKLEVSSKEEIGKERNIL